jgi:hypothetical protein
MAWVAVRSLDSETVMAGLDIRHAVRTAWRQAVDTIYASQSVSVHPVLVTPALNGFVLVASPVFFDEASDAEPERIERFVTELVSRLRTEVQYFATHRVIEGHAWARADVDGLRRAFFYLGEAGETLLDRMPKSTVEVQLWESTMDFIPDESTVMSVARAHGARAHEPFAFPALRPPLIEMVDSASAFLELHLDEGVRGERMDLRPILPLMLVR